MTKKSNRDIMEPIGRALSAHYKAMVEMDRRVQSPMLRSCSMVATAVTSQGDVLFTTPYPLISVGAISIVLVDGSPADADWEHELTVKRECAKALALQSYGMVSKVAAFVDEQQPED